MMEFIEIEKYGKLYMDRILFESYFPIVFTCKNESGQIFICVCCQNNEKGCKWLLGKTDGISIVRMLKDEITIRELLLKYSSGRISVNLIHGEYAIEYDSSDWNEDSIYLPKHDSYMYAEKGEFEEDITYFLSVGRVCYETEYYKNLSNVLKTIGKDLEPLTETMNLYASVLGNITIPSQTIRTLEVFGKLCSALPMNTEEYTNQEKYKLAFDSNFEAQSGNINIKVEANDHTLADAA